MHMLQFGVHFNDIALYLGHETPAMKEQALARLEEPPTVVPRYRPPDELRQFLEDL
jgi:integrase/recombinase XerD